MAITSGVSMNERPSPTIALLPDWPSLKSTSFPQIEPAGDQITGLWPSASSLQLVYSAVAAAPDETFCGRTNTHVPSACAFVALNDCASAFMRSSFSGDTDSSTT